MRIKNHVHTNRFLPNFQIYDDNAVILSIPSSPTDTMLEALESIINWNGPITFAEIEDKYTPTILHMSAKYGTSVVGCSCQFSSIMEKDATKITNISSELPNKVRVTQLSVSDTKFVSENRKFSTFEFTADEIQHFGGAGVYVDSELVSCALMSGIGSINGLWTDVNERGKGYAELAMRKVIEMATKKGLLPNVQVEPYNLSSQRLMEKLGFKVSHLVDIIFFKPFELQINNCPKHYCAINYN